jgi:hypothetical protein
VMAKKTWLCLLQNDSSYTGAKLFFFWGVNTSNNLKAKLLSFQKSQII